MYLVPSGYYRNKSGKYPMGSKTYKISWTIVISVFLCQKFVLENPF